MAQKPSIEIKIEEKRRKEKLTLTTYSGESNLPGVFHQRQNTRSSLIIFSVEPGGFRTDWAGR